MNTTSLLDEATRNHLRSVIEEGERARAMLALDGSLIPATEADEATGPEDNEPAVEPDENGQGAQTEPAGNTASATVTQIREKVDMPAARTWLREQGHTVSERGRIAGELLDQYRNRPQPAKATGAKATGARKSGAKATGTKSPGTGIKGAKETPPAGTAGIPAVNFNDGSAPSRRRKAS